MAEHFSKGKAYCGECKAEISRDKLQRHFNSQHGKKVAWEFTKGTDIRTVFTPRPRPTVATNNEQNDRVQLPAVADVVEESITSNAVIAGPSCPNPPAIVREPAIENDVIESINRNKRKKLDGEADLLENTSVHDKLDQILENQKKLDAISDQVNKLSIRSDAGERYRANPKPIKFKQFTEDDLLAARMSKSVVDLSKKLNLHIHYLTPEDEAAKKPYGLGCKTCAKPVGPATPGVFEYNSNKHGRSFENKQDKQPREFINVKTHAIEHVKSEAHINKYKAIHGDEDKFFSQRTEELRNKNYKVGLTIGMAAYRSIKDNASYQSFEREMAYLDSVNVEIGQLGHSRKQVPKYRDAFYEVLREEIKDHLDKPLTGTGQPTPVSIVVDGVTVNREKLNVVGINCLLDNKHRSLYAHADYLPSQGQTAQGTANSVHHSLQTAFGSKMSWEKRYVGTSADGQLLQLGYGPILDRLMNEKMEGSDATDFASHIHDGPHRIELANKDALASTELIWVKKRIAQMDEVTQTYSWGKSFRELRERAEGIDDSTRTMPLLGSRYAQMRAPALYHQMKWVAYHTSVLNNFNHNYSMYYQQLASKYDDKLDIINNSQFVSETAIISDVYKRVSILSEVAQTGDVTYWQFRDQLETTCKELGMMGKNLGDASKSIEDLENVKSQDGKQLLQNTLTAMTEVTQKQTFKGMPILDAQHYPVGNLTRQRAMHEETQQDLDTIGHIKNSRTRGSNLALSMEEALRARFNHDNEPTSLQESSALFSTQNVLNRYDEAALFEEEVPIPPELKLHVEKAKQVHYIPPETEMKEMEQQYRKLTDKINTTVRRMYEKCKSPLERRTVEKVFYHELLQGKHDSNTHKEVNHLLAWSLVRQSNASLVESMNSTVKDQWDNRGQLSSEDLSKEVFLRRNGPEPNRQARQLVERGVTKLHGNPEDWRFYRKTEQQSKLKLHTTSKVVDRLNSQSSGIRFMSNEERKEFTFLDIFLS